MWKSRNYVVKVVEIIFYHNERGSFKRNRMMCLVRYLDLNK